MARRAQKNGIEAMITDITATTAEAEDYTGEDGLLYCGKGAPLRPKKPILQRERLVSRDRWPSATASGQPVKAASRRV